MLALTPRVGPPRVTPPCARLLLAVLSASLLSGSLAAQNLDRLPRGFPGLPETGSRDEKSNRNAHPHFDPSQTPPSALGRPERQDRSSSPSPQIDRRVAQPKPKKPKGPPGMMGLPWPSSPEEAVKTTSDLLAHLATESDPSLARQIAGEIEKLWRLPGGDTVNLLIDRAQALTAKNDLDKALQILNVATKLAPDLPEVWNRRAYVLYLKENMAGALADLKRALALDPNHFRALDGMAKILEANGEKAAALKAYDALLKLYPEIDGAKSAAETLREEVQGKGI